MFDWVYEMGLWFTTQAFMIWRGKWRIILHSIFLCSKQKLHANKMSIGEAWLKVVVWVSVFSASASWYKRDIYTMNIPKSSCPINFFEKLRLHNVEIGCSCLVNSQKSSGWLAVESRQDLIAKYSRFHFSSLI